LKFGEVNMTAQREKLLKLRTLANFLDDLPHDKFHMPTWASDDFTDNSCGTAGCACGWAATIFANDGFSFVLDERNNPVPKFEGVYGSDAFASFFGISKQDASWITAILGVWDAAMAHGFSGWTLSSYVSEYDLASRDDITPRHAADRIRRVIAKYDPTILDEPTSCAVPQHDLSLEAASL
jgi:hypothetical protein